MTEFEVKERLAQAVFVDLMKDAGYNVKKIEYGETISMLHKEQINKKIFDIKEHKYDYVLNYNNNLYFMLVVYVEAGRLLKINKGLENAFIVIIQNQKPYFKINYVNSFLNSKKLLRLEKNPWFKIKPNLIKKFEKTLKKL